MKILNALVELVHVYPFSHLADPRKKQVENTVHLLVNTQTPCEALWGYRTSRHKFAIEAI